MANLETQQLDNIIASRRAMLLGGGAALAALALPKAASAAATVTTFTDNDILNFALNLEYLEANYYYLAAFGTTIDQPNPLYAPAGAAVLGITGTVGVQGTVVVKPSAKVPFVNTAIAGYAVETAVEEGKHVAFLRGALGTAAVAQPQIDLLNSFNTLAVAAKLGFTTFDPFASDAFFLIGAYVFEDVGVTAYHGAAPLLSTTAAGKGLLAAAAGILAVEGYHAGLVRTTINGLDPADAQGFLTITQKISALRSQLSQAAFVAGSTPPFPAAPGNPLGDDIGLTTNTTYS
ncbi:MAG: ferritin-like domain-containing protein, partial [Acidobacteriota bacterium]|nr:ferritin-like domain-containing protein [Acidobacteriota bacterium]